MRFCCLLFYFLAFNLASAQYTPAPSDSAELAQYKASELRSLFLATEPEVEVYQYGKASRRHTIWSSIMYSLGGLFVSAGVGVLLATRSEDFGGGVGGSLLGGYVRSMGSGTYLALGLLCLGGGVVETAASHKSLREGRALYQEKMLGAKGGK
jgi:ABC-type Fe3+ transport system permease subunit